MAPDAPLAAAIDEMVARDTSHVLVHGPRGALPIGVVSSFDVAAVVAGRDPRMRACRARLLRGQRSAKSG